jgi:hypothetical protein
VQLADIFTIAAIVTAYFGWTNHKLARLQLKERRQSHALTTLRLGSTTRKMTTRTSPSPNYPLRRVTRGRLLATATITLALLIALPIGCAEDDQPSPDAAERCNQWVEQVELGDAELNTEQEEAVRATLTIGDQNPADALAFWAVSEGCEALASLGLVGSDGSLSPTAIYYIGRCIGESEEEDVRACEGFENTLDAIREPLG